MWLTAIYPIKHALGVARPGDVFDGDASLIGLGLASASLVAPPPAPVDASMSITAAQISDAGAGGVEVLKKGSVSEIRDLVSGAPSAQAAYLAWRLANNIGHCSILICSDSTGATQPTGTSLTLDFSAARWPALLGARLQSQYPAYTVRLRFWNDTSSAYDAPLVIATGTGSYNLDLWIFAVSGTRPEYMLCKRLYKGAQEIVDTSVYADVSPEVNLYIINHGHNVTGLPAGDDAGRNVAVNKFAENVETVLLDHARAGVIVIGQNPEQTTDDNKLKFQAAKLYSSLRGFGFADVYSRFETLSRAASLYVTTDTPGDIKHPSGGDGTAIAPTGSRLFTDAVIEHIRTRADSYGQSNASWMSQPAANLLSNGEFATWTTAPGAPDNWTLTGTGGVCDKNTVEFEGFHGWSAKLTTGGASAYIDQLFSTTVNTAKLAACRGKWLSLAVRCFVPASETSSTVCRVGLNTSSNSTNNSLSFNNRDGGWHWLFLQVYVRPTDTYVRVRLYADSASSTGKTCYFDRAILRTGTVPRDSR